MSVSADCFDRNSRAFAHIMRWFYNGTEILGLPRHLKSPEVMPFTRGQFGRCNVLCRLHQTLTCAWVNNAI
jgi:hypothetical protein